MSLPWNLFLKIVFVYVNLHGQGVLNNLMLHCVILSCFTSVDVLTKAFKILCAHCIQLDSLWSEVDPINYYQPFKYINEGTVN